MRQRTRIALAAGGLVLAVVLGAALVVPRLIDLAPVRAEIVSQVSQRLGAEDVKIGALRLSLLPLPHLKLTGVEVSIPHAGGGTFASVSVSPHLLPLVRGRLELARLEVEGARVSAILPPPAGRGPAGAESAAGQDSFAAALAAAAAAVAAIGPGVTLVVGADQIEVNGAGAALSVRDADLKAHVGATGPAAWEADLRGSFAEITVRAGGQPLDVRGIGFGGSLSADRKTARATLDALDLEAPRLTLSGRFAFDQARPLAQLEVYGKDVDIASVRAAAEPFAADVPVIQAIFDVLREGTTAEITVRAEAPSAADLGAAIAIRGTLSGGRIHIPGVDLDLEEVSGSATVIDQVLEGEQASARVGNSRATAGSLRLGLSGDAPELHVEARVQADASELPALLKRILRNEAMARVQERLEDVQGTLAGKLVLGGTTRDVALLAEASQVSVSGRYGGLPLPLQVTGGPVTLDGRGIAASGLGIHAGASQFSVTSLQIDWSAAPSLGVTCGPSRIDLGELYPGIRAAGWLESARGSPDVLKGTVMADSLSVSGPLDTPSAWRFALAGVVDGFQVESPLFGDRIVLPNALSLTDVRLTHDPATGSSFSGSVAAPGAVQAALDIVWGPQELNVRRLQIRDRASDASFTLLSRPGKWTLTFDGHLVEATVATFVPKPMIHVGSLGGNFRAEIPFDQPMASTIQGRLQAEDVSLPVADTVRWTVQRLSLDATANRANVDAAVRLGGGDPVQLEGTVEAARDAIVVNLDASTAHLDLAGLDPLLGGDGAVQVQPAANGQHASVRGTVRLAAEALTYRSFTWKPFHAALTLAPAGTTVTIGDAVLCGIATPGTITLASERLDLAAKPSARNASLDATLACLLNKPGLVTGAYTFNGNLTARGTAADVARSIRGPVAFEATKGQVEHLPVLAKVFSVLSIATGSVRNIVGIADKGLPYDRFTIKGDLLNGTLRLTEAVMDGPTVKIAGEGTIDLANGTVDLTLLVAPLVAAGNLVAKIPVVGGFLGGNLVSIPVKVSGPLQDPSATPLSPTAVSQTLVGLMKRTVKLPLHAIEPFLPDWKF